MNLDLIYLLYLLYILYLLFIFNLWLKVNSSASLGNQNTYLNNKEL